MTDCNTKVIMVYTFTLMGNLKQNANGNTKWNNYID